MMSQSELMKSIEFYTASIDELLKSPKNLAQTVCQLSKNISNTLQISEEDILNDPELQDIYLTSDSNKNNSTEVQQVDLQNSKQNDHTHLLKIATFLLLKLSKNDLFDKENLLNPNQLQNLQKVMGFVVYIGIKPNLLPGLDSTNFERFQFEDSEHDKYEQIKLSIVGLTSCCKNNDLFKKLVSGHLNELFTGLFQLIYAPVNASETTSSKLSVIDKNVVNKTSNVKKQIEFSRITEIPLYRNILKDLISSLYEPTILKELIILLNSNPQLKKPAWFKKAVSKELTSIFLKPTGMASLLRALFPSDSFDSGGQWRQIETVIKMILGFGSSDAYYSNVFGQILALPALMHINMVDFEKNDKTLVKIICNMIIKTLIRDEKSDMLEKYLLDKICSPLLRCNSGINKQNNSNESTNDGQHSSNNCKNVKCEENDNTSIDNNENLRKNDREKSVTFQKDHTHEKDEANSKLDPLLSNSEIDECIKRVAFFLIPVRDSNMIKFDLRFLLPYSQILFFIHCKYEEYCCDQTVLTSYILVQFLKNIKFNSVAINSVFDAWLFNESNNQNILTVNECLTVEESEGISGIVITYKDGVKFKYASDLAIENTHSLVKKSDMLIGFFLFLTKKYTELCRDKATVELNNTSLLNVEATDLQFISPITQKKMICIQYLEKLITDKYILEKLLDHSNEIVELLINILRTYTEIDTKNFEDSEEIFLCLMITEVVDLQKVNPSKLNEFLKILTCIKNCSKNEELTTLLDLRIEKLQTKPSKKASTQTESLSELDQAINDVNDGLIPVQAHGLMTLIKLVQKRNPSALARKQYILLVFMRFLKQEDSYLYLTAVNGLAVMAFYYSDIVVPILTEEYTKLDRSEKSSTDDKINLRLKYGEILVRVTKQLHEMAPKYKTILINAALCGLRDYDSLIRASNLSNLGEICEVLGFKIGNLMNEVILSLSQLIQTEKEIEPKRAAVFVIRKILSGLGKDAIVELKDHILPIYRWLKHVYTIESDAAMKLQAQLALELLNDITKEFLSLERKQSNLEINLFDIKKISDVRFS